MWDELAVFGTPLLFGYDRDRPFARIDQAGLLWLLNGDRLVMLAEHLPAHRCRRPLSKTVSYGLDAQHLVLGGNEVIAAWQNIRAQCGLQKEV